MEESCPVSPPRARNTSAPGRGFLTSQPPNSPPAAAQQHENDGQPPPDKSSGKRKREPGVGDKKSDSGGGRDPMTEIKKGLAFFPGAVSVQTFSEGKREHIESRLTFQRAYDSVDILSNGRPVEGGIDLDKAPVLAGVIDEMTGLVGVRPDCVHMTTREGDQIHTSHPDKMEFDARGTVHLGADVLFGGQVDSTKSTGDFVLSSGGPSKPLLMPMRSGDTYIAADKVLHAPFLHGISPPDQASLSVVCTWPPGKMFHLFRGKTHPLAESFPSFCGVKAVDGEEAFQVTTTDRVPPKKIKARIRQSGDFTDGVSLFRAPPEEQASAYHRLGMRNKGKKGSPNGANSCYHDGCACVSDEAGKCVCQSHVHIKSASVATNCPCKGGNKCTCVDHTHYSNASAAGATLGTGANQVGGAPSDGAAARVRKPIPGQPGCVKAHGFCFGFGADGVGLAQKLRDEFAGETGFGDGPITEGGCQTQIFKEAGVTKGKSKWELDEHDNLILPAHNTNGTEGPPSCVIGGTVPVEKVKGSWRLCSWALPYISARRIVPKIT